MSQPTNLEEGTSGQLPTGHRNDTNTDVLGHIQNSGVEVEGISSSSNTGRESTRHFYRKVLLPLVKISLKVLLPLVKISLKVLLRVVKISPYMWYANKISIEPFLLYDRVIDYDTKDAEFDDTLLIVYMTLEPLHFLFTIGSLAFLIMGMDWRVLKIFLVPKECWVGFKKFLARPECPVSLLKKFLARAMKGLRKKNLPSIIWCILLLNDLVMDGPQLFRLTDDQLIDGRSGWPDYAKANLFLLQYFLFVILLYITFTRDTSSWAAKATWAKAAFNLLLYVHGGHVFGGLWYTLAIQKAFECWNKACEHYGLDMSFCPSQHYKFINEFCPTKTRNTTAFDFGIYHDALESGILEMWSIPRRVFYCFRWGLQNLSGFGQNIQTSTDVWENIFVISITIYGMVLFVFFIGNMQIYLQSQTNKSEMIRQKKKEIEQSKSFEKLSENLQKQIKRYQPAKWKETECGVEFGNLFNNLPVDLIRNIKHQLCLELLRKVEEFSQWSEELLHELCDCAKPVSYAEHVEIIRSGSSIDKMLFVVQGKLCTCTYLTSVNPSFAASSSRSEASSSRFEASINHLEDGEFCGKELVDLYPSNLNPSNLPISNRTIHTTTKVDAFILMYYDLQNVFIKASESL